MIGLANRRGDTSIFEDAPVWALRSPIASPLNKTSPADQQQPKDDPNDEKVEEADAPGRKGTTHEAVEQVRHQEGLGHQ